MDQFLQPIAQLLDSKSTESDKQYTSRPSAVQTLCENLRERTPTARPDDIQAALTKLANGIQGNGMSEEAIVRHIKEDIEKGLATGQSGPRYFGFVTGGSLPAAQCGDIMATCYDQNVQVHLPTESISTALEHRTLDMILDLLCIHRSTFPGRSLTSGATASNILGMACARDYVIRKVLNDPAYSVGDSGFPMHPRPVRIWVLTDKHHASIEKAAAVVGIGRKSIIDLSQHASFSEETTFADRLRETINAHSGPKEVADAYIVVASCGEVNTGDFTDLERVREICDENGAWLHIDAAFGALACLLPEYAYISKDLALADSVTTDGHKWFNVPYSCGVFFCRDLALQTSILAGSSIPAYLASSSSSQTYSPETEWVTKIPSPLHTNLENSRRFIALPLYCALLNQGRKGYADIVKRNVQFARDLAVWMGPNEEGGKWYECLNLRKLKDGSTNVPLNVVLFRARDVEGVPSKYRGATATLITDINALKEIYISPGSYPGGAVRLAVSNWMTGHNDDGQDLERTKKALRNVMISI